MAVEELVRPLKIYALISKVMADVGAIAKSGTNELDNYAFRKIDDVYNKLQPILAKHGVFFVPSVTESSEDKFQSEDGQSWVRVKLTVNYRIYCDDGSSIDSIVRGEAIDNSDKATNKALTAAFKYLLIQVFCIAVQGLPDADKDSPSLSFVKEKAPRSEPRADHRIGDGVYKGRMVSEIPKAELLAYIKRMEKAAKENGRKHPKWFADLKKAVG